MSSMQGMAQGGGQGGQRPQGAQGGQQRPQQGMSGQRPEGGQRPQGGQRPEGGQSGGQRPQGGQGDNQRPQGAPGGSSEPNWVDVHGAGSQRSDPKSGDASIYANGHGPQGDVVRIYNYVRLVRD